MQSLSPSLSTRSSVLGKRSYHRDESTNCSGQLLTPDPTPKRPKTSATELDGDHNKENVPPYNVESINTSPSARAARALRRSSTDSVSPATPTRPVCPRSASISPVSPIDQVRLASPPPTPASVQPLHVRARVLLRATCDGSVNMPGRDNERKSVSEFITHFVDNHNAHDFALYVSGSPGTGKTALINSIIQNMALEECQVRPIVVNCMALDSVDALRHRLMEEFVPTKKGRKSKPSVTFDTAVASLKTKCLLVLDELDHIASTSQTLDSLLTIPNSNPSMLRVIGIANTHTLTSSLSTSRNIQTLHFTAYSSQQLLQIIQARLAPLCSESDAEIAKKFMATPALTLLSKKVAAMTGDVRTLFEILRGAINLSVAEAGADDPVLQPAHILAALKAHTPKDTRKPGSTSNSEIVNKICQLGLQARLVILTILLASRRLEAGLGLSSSPSSPSKYSNSISAPAANNGLSVGLDTTPLYAYYGAILTRAENGIFGAVSRSEFGDLLNLLEDVGLVSSATSPATQSSPSKRTKRSFGRSASFSSVASRASVSGQVRMASGVWVDEVLRGLGVTRDSKDLQEEEIRCIWEREKARLEKDIKSVQARTPKSSTFEDAMEV